MMMDVLTCKKRHVFCNLLEDHQKKMTKTALLQKAKELNIPRQNCMKTKQELEKAMKDTFIVYKEITFCARYPYMYKMLR